MELPVSEFDRKYDIEDIVTPRHTMLSARYKRSFAYYTMRERLPVILTNIIDSLTKDKDDIAQKYEGEKTREEIKAIVGHISKLKYQLQTDKQFEELQGSEPDLEMWNTFIKRLPINFSSFFQSAWLYSECYMYRRVASFFLNSETLKNYDYFFKQKCRALQINAVLNLAKSLKTTDRSCNTFSRILKMTLWGNKCDLSLIISTICDANDNLFEHCDKLDSHILVDNSESIWKCLESADISKPVVVDIVLDNAGFEFFTDLILADYLLSKQLAQKVRFHTKPIPWFVSDVTPLDFHHTLQYLEHHESIYLSELGKKWKKYVADGLFEMAEINYFWSSPYEYYRMREVNIELYTYLSQAHLVIFKGDLNYRKLLGDMNWDPTDDFLTCLRGFQPTNICTLRTVKADLICGLQQGLSEDLCRQDPKWMETGEYGVIQFMESFDCNCSSEINKQQ
ncbi:damage-control phosphatase ARMT1-like [Haematobia irritans]|uniref:damage-control phosphatase ARMT1-like n=1 Tax=Haematobia irritans TaxID=7368 RepID=UPI003F4FCA97